MIHSFLVEVLRYPKQERSYFVLHVVMPKGIKNHKWLKEKKNVRTVAVRYRLLRQVFKMLFQKVKRHRLFRYMLERMFGDME